MHPDICTRLTEALVVDGTRISLLRQLMRQRAAENIWRDKVTSNNLDNGTYIEATLIPVFVRNQPADDIMA